MCCGYSLEVPWQSASMSIDNIFFAEIKNIFTQYSILSGQCYQTQTNFNFNPNMN